MATAQGAATTDTATLADDELITVAVDSRTGEMRECGESSGVSVSISPSTEAIADEQAAPERLTEPRLTLSARGRIAQGG